MRSGPGRFLPLGDNCDPLSYSREGIPHDHTDILQGLFAWDSRGNGHTRGAVVHGSAGRLVLSWC
jgi:hypothetical protein